MKPLILASKSPRRKELLEEMGLSFSIVSKDIPEHLCMEYGLQKAVEALAKEKAQAVFADHMEHIVIGADTIVALDGEVFGKPKDEQDAKRMLRLLSGRTHQVIGGVAILSKEKTMTFSCVTQVSFYPIGEEEIDRYVQSKEPMDKAGAYGIQGLGKYFVKEIHGDYFNVVGLPISRVLRFLQQFPAEK